MADVEYTPEQLAMWDKAVAMTGQFGVSFTSTVAQTAEKTLDVAGNAIHTVNHNTPSLFGRPMTEILGVDDPLQNLKDGVSGFVSGALAAAPEMLLKQAVGATPADMVVKFSENEALQTAEGQQLIAILKADPEFTEALHKAMVNNPSMAEGIQKLADGQQVDGAEGPSLKTLVDGLSDDANRGKFTQVLNAVGENRDLDFKYVMDVADAAHDVSQPSDNAEKRQGEYKRLQTLLAKAGVQDVMLDFAAEPEKVMQDFLNDPSKFMDQLAASSIHLEGPIGDMLRGIVQGLGQYIELLADPNIKAFYGEYIQPLVDDIPNAAAQLGIDLEETASTTPTSNIEQDLGAMPSFEDVLSLATSPSGNNGSANLDTDIGVVPAYEEMKLFVNGNTDLTGAMGNGLNTQGHEKLKLGSSTFNLESLGITPSVTAAEAQKVADYDAQTEILRRPQGGMSFGTPSLVG